MVNCAKKRVVILKRLLLFVINIALIACNNGPGDNDIIQQVYRSDFYTPIMKIVNLRGKVDSTYFPGGKIIITYFRFESKELIKIKGRENYRKIDPNAVLDFMSKKSVMDKKDIELLLANRNNLSCLFFEQNFSADSSAATSQGRFINIKKWIILWPKGKTYFGIHLKEEKFFSPK